MKGWVLVSVAVAILPGFHSSSGCGFCFGILVFRRRPSLLQDSDADRSGTLRLNRSGHAGAEPRVDGSGRRFFKTNSFFCVYGAEPRADGSGRRGHPVDALRRMTCVFPTARRYLRIGTGPTAPKLKRHWQTHPDAFATICLAAARASRDPPPFFGDMPSRIPFAAADEQRVLAALQQFRPRDRCAIVLGWSMPIRTSHGCQL